MHYQPTYDSRDPRYKTPYGAVASGSQVTLTLRPPRREGFCHASLSARFESRRDETLTLKMHWQGIELGRDMFSAVLDIGDYVGLVWYSFRLERMDGQKQELGPYQLTVYDSGEEVPSWFGEGVTYQIFPDRFRRSRIPDPAGLVGGRSVHQNWDEQPEYRPDHRGEIRNRDFFGGDLPGVLEKLDYLKSMGWRPSTSTPFLRRRRTTATGPPTTARWTPCWARTRTSPACARRPTAGGCG